MNSSIVRKFVSSTTVMALSETFWLFGYGSNMDATNLEQKKNVKVLGSTYIHDSRFLYM